MTRWLSVTANCPSRKKPSRGVVAIQLGLPRPAFKKADCVVLEFFLASFINSSLISNGLRVSKVCKFKRSTNVSFLGLSRQHHDQDHAPDCEECISHGIGDGVSESGN